MGLVIRGDILPVWIASEPPPLQKTFPLEHKVADFSVGNLLPTGLGPVVMETGITWGLLCK